MVAEPRRNVIEAAVASPPFFPSTSFHSPPISMQEIVRGHGHQGDDITPGLDPGFQRENSRSRSCRDMIERIIGFSGHGARSSVLDVAYCELLRSFVDAPSVVAMEKLPLCEAQLYYKIPFEEDIPRCYSSTLSTFLPQSIIIS